ncbi:MAG: DUF695 domain-containing protein [Beutenbergiaceae bacterium]
MGIFSRKQKLTPQFHDDDFGVYMRDLDGFPATVMVNLTVHEMAPVPALPYFFTLHVPYPLQKQSGLPTEEQLHRLQRIEGIARDVAGTTVPHRHAMSVTHNGTRSIGFYVPSQRSLREFDATLLSRLGADAEELGFTEYDDPAWASYLEDVYPQPHEYAQMKQY